MKRPGMEITVQELKHRLDTHEELILIDVREPYERELSHLGGRLAPIGSIPQAIQDLFRQKDREIVVYCRTGNRSGMVVAFLRQQGFNRARNLRGGMTAWKKEIDPSLVVA